MINLVRLGNLNDLDDVLIMLNLCKEDMKRRKLNIWNDNYPSTELIESDLKSGNSVVYDLNGKVVAFLVMLPNYECENEEKFSIHNNHCYIQRVMVHPDYRRHGYAQEILNYVEKQNFSSIRLLTRNTNTYSVNLYTKLGYKVVMSEIKGNEVMQTCEKIIKK